MSARAINTTISYRIKQDIEEETYREYIAKCIRICTENTAKMSGGRYINEEYYDIIHPKPKDNRKPEEIVSDIICRAGIEVV